MLKKKNSWLNNLTMKGCKRAVKWLIARQHSPASDWWTRSGSQAAPIQPHIKGTWVPACPATETSENADRDAAAQVSF